MKAIQTCLRGLLYAAVLLGGFAIYLLRRKTPGPAYQSMVKLFCQTGGRSNDRLSKLIGRLEKRYVFRDADGVLGNMTEDRTIHAVTRSLRENGYYQFENRLPDDLCDRLLEFATTAPVEAYQMDGEEPGSRGAMVYPRANPRAVRYEISTEALLGNKDVQRLLADTSLAAVAQEYLGAKPVIDVLSMWWLTAYSDKPDSKAAQYFHFDMDRPKWLKFFIYLTDVTPTNGPHTFVSGSHRTGAIPQHLLQKGYARLSDEEVERVFTSNKMLEFCGRRGSILAEDTRGLHKGRHVEQGDRLMLQIQFSNSLFGADYPKHSFRGELESELQNCVARYAQLYSAYL